MVLVGPNGLWGFFGGSWLFLVFLVVLGGSGYFLVVLGGFWLFLEILGGFW